ncbi:MAG TPA: hypothetical protein VJV05_17580 [Pyrinomonadaceae bacterium]|nr:hypothetical protein [Pyrinomonadaceae bacterium]
MDDPLDRWLEESRYRAWEAADVFQLLDQVSDFTVRKRPDVVFLHVGGTTEELAFARSLIQAGIIDSGVPVIDLVSDPAEKEMQDLDCTISVLATQLDHYIPRENAATS